MHLRAIILLVFLFAEQMLISVAQLSASEFLAIENAKTVAVSTATPVECKRYAYQEHSLGTFAGTVRSNNKGQKQITDPLPPIDKKVSDKEVSVENVSKTSVEDKESTLPEKSLSERSDWYVDATNGDDDSGDGSRDHPFKSIQKILSIYELQPDYLSSGDTLYLAAGNYDKEAIAIDVPELNLVGTLDKYGRPASVMGEVTVLANGVSLMNFEFFDAGVTLQNVENVAVCGNVFSGITKTGISILGSSNNFISRNEFRSSTQTIIRIDWDPESGKTSSGNTFLKNYFTHPAGKKTERVILVECSSGKNESISFRNRFIECAFEELEKGKLNRVIDDRNPPSMVVEHRYSVRFEDCYFKRADRTAPFSELTFLEKGSKSQWRWDELDEDEWVVLNKQHAITGDRKKMHVPRVQFADENNNGKELETTHGAGLLFSESSQKDLPQIEDDVEDDAAVLEASENTVAAIASEEIALEAVHSESVASEVAASTEEKSLTPVVKDVIHNRSDWYVDSVKGNDESGEGSETNPFRTINAVLNFNESYPGYVESGDTLYLAAGEYGSDSIEIDIAGLNIKGTLDKHGKPVSVLKGDVKITASDVMLANCKFLDVGLTLKNTENVHISNNVFSGSTEICLSLLGASENTVSHNEFRSAMYDCVYIYWDPSSGNASSDNVFLRNYFTHRPDDVTDRVIRVNWSPGNNNSISARNRFIGCAFKETVSGQLKRIIDDDSTWWMVVDHKYSVKFEDCYFKRADRVNPFREFVILNGHPTFKWRWDELVNDIWVTANTQFSLTGDYNNWNHKPRLQFVDGDKNGTALEMGYHAGLFPSAVGTTNVIEE